MMPVNNRISSTLPATAEVASSAMTAATNENRTNEEYFEIWRAWEREAPCGETEARQRAFEKLRDCLLRGSVVLNFYDLSLSSFPEIPLHVVSLILAGNQLTALSELPANLKSLDVSDNQLTSLSGLPANLESLNATGNQLTTLSALPQNLEFLDVSHNRLEALPALPPLLSVLMATDNNLTTAPSSPASLRIIYLDNNNLTVLPALSSLLTYLSAGNNRLTEFPRSLPHTLRHLDLSANQITEFPSILPPLLQNINVSFNQITEIPFSLPQTLQHINASSNRITRFPHLLPQSLLYINLSVNPIAAFPPSPSPSLRMLGLESGLAEFVMNMRRGRWVNVERRHLGEQPNRTRQNIMSELSLQGAGIYFSVDGDPVVDDDFGAARPLNEVVAIWLPVENDMEEKWNAIATEENAAAFSAFLTRLAGTVSARRNPEFKEMLVTWLTMLAQSPALREMIFTVALGATESCNDRVAYSWNEMQKVVLVHRIESGEFDENISDLVDVGRIMFRLERLEEIARDKVEELNKPVDESVNPPARPLVDELETYLALQTMLRDDLALLPVNKEMTFFSLSGITTSDLKTAAMMVKSAENSEFPDWFSQWTPWHKVLERTEPTRWQQAMEVRYEALEGEYSQRVASEQATVGLTGDADVERGSGKKVMQEMDNKIFAALTHEVMTARGLASLLNWRWPA